MQLTKLAQTMSHIQLSELTGIRRDSVKRTMETLETKGVIQLTQNVEVNHKGQSFTAYHVNERDSYIVVAQLSPEFTAKLVDYWMAHKNQAPALPATYKEALIALVAEVEAKEAAEARALHAEKTKSQISSRREAQVMGKLGAATKRIISLENKLQDVGDYQSILAAGLPERVDTETKGGVQTWRLLKQISNYKKIEIKKVNDPRFGSVNTYHIEVINEFKELYL